jgi:hypothetical protein
MRRLALALLGVVALALPATAAASTDVSQSPLDVSVLACDGATIHLTGEVVQTFVNLFHIQATAGGQSFDVSEVAHITVTPAGSVSVAFDNFSSTC